MNPKTSKILGWIAVIFGGLGGLAVVGLAAGYWIHLEVQSQVKEISIPDTSQLITDVEVIKGSITNIETNIGTMTSSQQRFEIIFMEYLAKEATR